MDAMTQFEHAPELNTDSPAYEAVIRELDKIVYGDPEDVAQGLTLRDSFISTESLLADYISIFMTKERQEEDLKNLSEALRLNLTLSTPIWKIVKDYESLVEVQ
jgi:hypothetical protein